MEKMRIDCAMKEQYSDMLYLNGMLFNIWQLPLETYLYGWGWGLTKYSTPDCERGYVAVWTLIDGRLYLIAVFPANRLHNVLPPIENGKKLMNSIFPHNSFIPAMWYTGNLTIHNANRCKALGYGRMENRDMQLYLYRGVVTSGNARISVYGDEDYRYYLSFVDVKHHIDGKLRFV